MITHTREFVRRCRAGDFIQIDEETFIKFRKIRDGEVTLRVVNPLQLRFAHEKKEPSPGRAAGRAGRAAGAGR